MSRNTDLDVENFSELPAVLRHAADKFYESVGELNSAWQDKQAGKVWGPLGEILVRAARQIDVIMPEVAITREQMEEGNLELDVATPEEVADVLREAADEFKKLAEKGNVWHRLVIILNRAARACDTAVNNHS